MTLGRFFGSHIWGEVLRIGGYSRNNRAMSVGPTAKDMDRFVGSRIRMRRRQLGISQTKLAQTLGLAFQQVQKYELGQNRVSASKLFFIAQALDTTVEHFFNEFEFDVVVPRSFPHVDLTNTVDEFLNDPGCREMARFTAKLSHASRLAVVNLVRACLKDEAGLNAKDT